MRQYILAILRSVNRKIFSTNWKDFRTVKPISRIFGEDRGKPIDRYYIETFLSENKDLVKGTVLEIGDDYYSKLNDSGITKQEILHFTADNSNATIVGDLTKKETLPHNLIDCFICTQTLNFIYDFKSAIEGIHYLLNKGGYALITLSGISQISRYDMDRWGDFWRFTPKSAKNIFSEIFGEENVEVKSYGNVLAAISLLQGISVEELKEEELMFYDKDYPVTITVKVKKV